MLELRFLNVGQGDAILIRNGGKTVLVDAGETDGIAARLRQLGVDSIGLAVASHNDNDHIGGMDAVLRSLPVRYYLDNGFPKTTRIQRTVLELVRDRGVTYLQPGPRTVEVGDARVRVVPSPVAGRNVAQNDHSVALLVERGAFRALLTGDSEKRELAALVRAGDVPDVDVFKAPHHGSRTGVLDAFLARARPEVIVISVGLRNPFGHPHEEALAAYQTPGRTVLRTDRDGDVVVSVDAAGCYEARTARSGTAVLARGGPPTCAAHTHQGRRP
jgi:beta-lactamase superfamily II metal-dependent hydrolase